MDFPNQYAAKVNFTSTGADVGFGFDAAFVRLRNDAAKSVYVTLRSTTGGSTADYELGSSEALDLHSLGARIGGLSFVATSSGGSLRIGAWG